MTDSEDKQQTPTGQELVEDLKASTCQEPPALAA
jgi:hypothetical protein